MEIGYHLSPGVWRGYGSIFLGISLHGNMNVVWIKILIYTRCFSQCLNTVSYALEEPDRDFFRDFSRPPPTFSPALLFLLEEAHSSALYVFNLTPLAVKVAEVILLS